MGEDRISFFSARRVRVAGHSGAIGGAILPRLWREPCEILLASRAQPDLLRQDDVECWMRRHRPEGAFLAADQRATGAGRAGARARALREMLAINLNVPRAAFRTGAEALGRSRRRGGLGRRFSRRAGTAC